MESRAAIGPGPEALWARGWSPVETEKPASACAPALALCAVRLRSTRPVPLMSMMARIPCHCCGVPNPIADTLHSRHMVKMWLKAMR